MPNSLNYVLITPARNEEEFIDLTIRSVVLQTFRPLKWVVVSDGSTDQTDEIVKGYTEAYPWIQLLRMPERKDRHFAGKAYAVNAGRAQLTKLRYDVIGNLDADVSFDSNYFEFLMARFADDPKLGCAGTAFREKGMSYNYEFVGAEHVSGMCQMFRRECFEEIGGYSAVESGGIDLIAVLSARAKGWETQTFTEKAFEHHRIQGGALHSGLRERVRTGRKDYLLGNHERYPDDAAAARALCDDVRWVRCKSGGFHAVGRMRGLVASVARFAVLHRGSSRRLALPLSPH